MAVRKGYMRVLEMTIASVMLITFLAVMITGGLQKEESSALAKTVYGTYDFLDKSNQLRKIAVMNPVNLTHFSDSLELLIPPVNQYTVGYANQTDNVLLGSIPENKSIHIFSHVISGYESTYRPIIFYIYIW